MKVEFWFEFGSTYSYPTAVRIEKLAHERGVEILWRPFLLGPIFRDQGWNDSPFNLYPAKGRYMWRDLERICDTLGIPLKRPSHFPRNGVLAARVACRFANRSWLPAFVRAVYHANFAEDRDISDPKVIEDCLAQAPVAAPSILTESQTPESKALLRGQTAQAQQHGIFGAPSFVADGELFWGNDRLEQALDWHTDARGPTNRCG